MLEIDPALIGTLEMDGYWVPYLDLYHLESVPTRIKLANDEYAFLKSAPVLGHGAILPAEIRAARSAGKKPIVVERDDRYYLYLAPP